MEYTEKEVDLKSMLENVPSIDYSYADFFVACIPPLELNIDAALIFTAKYKKILDIGRVNTFTPSISTVNDSLKKAHHYTNSIEDTFI